MAHSTSSSSALSSRSSSSRGSPGFKVYGSVFKVSSRYQFLNPLGKGSYGVVCAAKDRETGQCVAIKKVTPMAKRTTDAKHTLREVLLLEHLGKHPNVISIHNLSANIKDDELDTGENRERGTMEKPRSVLTPSVIPSATPPANSSGSGARMSKIHATLRQAQEQSREHERKTTSEQHTSVVTFGSNRQRIRTTSKPPVPKQQEANICVSNQHDNVRVVAAQATLLSDSLASRVSPPPEEVETKLAASIEDVSTQSRESTAISEPKRYARTSLSARSYTNASKPSPLATVLYNGGSLPEASDALATCMALTKRSKALIASLASSSGTSASFHHSQAWQTNQSKNPEHSASSSSSSSASSHDSKVCTGISRSNRPGSAFLTKTIKKKPEESVSASIAVGRPRRVSSAGPTRSKLRVLPGNGSHTARNSSATNAYVSSINSLIRAQRSNNGQSLADSANSMLANMRPNKQQEPFDSREEYEPSTSGKYLKTQRSTSKLPGADPMEKKNPAKKLTVPKSPKFSVMSWQKKNETRAGYTSSMLR
ncbi:hypothetical protein PC122_g4295 [Phytophthora cactorum]|nr:hypothetical protein PC122_g4295 [Phytophthora cactorum]